MSLFIPLASVTTLFSLDRVLLTPWFATEQFSE